MKRSAIVLLGLLAISCDEDPPDSPAVASAKFECRALLQHIVEISPEGKGIDSRAFVDELPIEDILGCVATDPLMRKCMLYANDVAGIRACPGECLGTVIGARNAQRWAAKISDDQTSPEIDKILIPIAKGCLEGDTHAADSLKRPQ